MRIDELARSARTDWRNLEQALRTYNWPVPWHWRSLQSRMIAATLLTEFRQGLPSVFRTLCLLLHLDQLADNGRVSRLQQLTQPSLNTRNFEKLAETDNLINLILITSVILVDSVSILFHAPDQEITPHPGLAKFIIAKYYQNNDSLPNIGDSNFWEAVKNYEQTSWSIILESPLQPRDPNALPHISCAILERIIDTMSDLDGLCEFIIVLFLMRNNINEDQQTELVKKLQKKYINSDTLTLEVASSKFDNAREYFRQIQTEKKLRNLVMCLHQTELTLRQITLNKRIGSGSFGTVYSALNLTKKVALKVPKTEENIPTYQKEMDMLLMLKHKNIVHAEAIGGPTLEILQLELLHWNLRDYFNLVEIHPLETKIKIAKGISRGLEYLHKNNITHNDLSHRNVCLTDTLTPKLIDFGNAAFFENPTIGKNISIGTPIFAAKIFFTAYHYYSEAVMNFLDAKAAEINSLGLLLVFIFYNVTFPVDDKKALIAARQERIYPDTSTHPLRDTDSAVVAQLTDLFERCCSKKPEDGPTASEVAEWFSAKSYLLGNGQID